MNPASSLYQLQKIDSVIHKAKKRIAAIQQEINGDRRVQRAQQAEKAAVQTLMKTQQHLRGTEEKVKEMRIKIETSNGKLYGGRITNPKELQDIQLEIASCKKRMAQLEEEQLSAMIQLEEAESQKHLAEKNLQLATSDLLSEQAVLRGEHNKLTKTLQRLLSERDVIVGSIAQDYIDIYDELLKSKHGTAVAIVEDNACAACGSTLQSATLQAAKSPKEITFCPFCKRILYAG